MSHPFDLNLSDLEAIEIDFGEELTDREAAQISGGHSGGDNVQCISAPCPGSETGGSTFPGIVYPTSPSLPIRFSVPTFSNINLPPFNQPEPEPDVTTLAVGEEGGGWYGTGY